MPMSFDFIPPKVNAVARLAVAVPVAVELGGKVLLEASRQDCPVDTGQMAASGKAELEGTHTVAVSYERTGADGYNVAARQHEDMTLNHPKGGKAKWLESHMHSDAEAIFEAMATALRTGL